MEKWQKRIEFAVNVAIFCAFVLVATLAGKRLFERESNGKAREPLLGATVSLPGADWNKSDENLVLFLSTGCHFCSESAEFYKRLIPTATSRQIQVLAVLPQAETEGRSYLQLLGVPVPAVMQGSLSSVNVSSTPTILLLDRQGKLRKAWVGKLNPQEEQQVLASLEPQSFHP